MVGLAALTLFYLIPMVCKSCGISETHRIKAAQPTLRYGTFLWITSNRTDWNNSKRCQLSVEAREKPCYFF